MLGALPRDLLDARHASGFDDASCLREVRSRRCRRVGTSLDDRAHRDRCRSPHAASRQSASIAMAPNAPGPILCSITGPTTNGPMPTASSLSRSAALSRRDRVVRRGDHADAAANDLAVHPRHDRLRAARHRENHAREAHEELLARARIANRRQLIERRAGAERTRSVAAQQNRSHVVACAEGRDLGRESAQH